jgi:hypothetical protein
MAGKLGASLLTGGFMNIVIFVLGAVSALVVLLIAAVVVILLKMKGVSELTRWFDKNLGEVYQRIGTLEAEVNRRIDEVARDASDAVRELDSGVAIRIDNDVSLLHKEKDRLDRKIESTLNDSLRYTDSRIDKLPNKK